MPSKPRSLAGILRPRRYGDAEYKHLDVLVRFKALRHGAHPVLSWMASNLMWEKDAADNWKPSKKKSREKIDGMAALIMAIGVGLALPSDTTGSLEQALREEQIEIDL